MVEPARRPEVAAPPAPTRRPWAIVGPAYDWAFFLLPPLVSLGLGFLISGSRFAGARFRLGGVVDTGAGFLIGTMIHAHLVAVFVRSHGNPTIFRTHPLRFTLAPLLVYGAIVASPWIAVAATVVATLWDVWHSAAQTFGFGRIYDRNRGAPPEVGRRLDFWLNQLLYAGPILAGATLIDHLDPFEGFADLGDTFFSAIPARVVGHRRWLTWLVIGGGTLFLAGYLLAYHRLHRRGHRFSRAKVFLYASTGLCSIYAWGFNSWGQAFFIMNLFHAVQYLALVWATEKGRMTRLLRMPARPAGRALTACAFFGLTLAYGFGAQILDEELTALWAVTIVVSLMHFWYDAFIWSVRRNQV